MKIDEKMYEFTAEQYGVTVEEVKRDIQEAIKTAFANPDGQARNIPRSAELPTLEEIFEYLFAKSIK